MIAKTFFKTPASRTLLIPLAVRVLESRAKNGLFTDEAALRLAAKLPEELFAFSMNPFMRIGTAVRINYFDTLLRDFVARHDTPVIVQLGCGLDTRFERTDTGKGVYINLDLPEVMDVRKELLPAGTPRCAEWALSILDFQWMDRLKEEYPKADFMFIAEGVLMYLEKQGVEAFFRRVGEHFSGSRLLFDTTSTRVAKIIDKRTVVGQMGASFLWPYDDDGGIEACHPALRRLSKQYYFTLYESRWGMWRYAHYVPGLGKESVMYDYEVAA